MGLFAKLIDDKVVECDDAIEWAEWREANHNKRRVAFTLINRRKKIFVSTIFLGIEHGIFQKQWFETMVFGSSIDDQMKRYPDIESARKGHSKMVGRTRQARQIRNPRLRKSKRNWSWTWK